MNSRPRERKFGRARNQQKRGPADSCTPDSVKQTGHRCELLKEANGGALTDITNKHVKVEEKQGTRFYLTSTSMETHTYTHK